MWCHDAAMRVNLISQSSARPASAPGPIPVSLMIRPSCGLPGDYEYSTDSASLMFMLRRKTDLRADILKQFETACHGFQGQALCVNLDDRVFTEIGYFVD